MDGTVATYTRDHAGRTTRVQHQGNAGGATLADFQYTLDASGQRTNLAETLAQVGGGMLTPSTTYAYDGLARLTSDGTNTYSYDPVGNRSAWGATTYSYDRADRITAAGSTSYTVDALGNTTARGTDTFAYDHANRLTRATVSGITSTYTWDGDGRRATASTGGATTTFTYDTSGALPMLLSDGTRTYVWGAAGLAYTVTIGTGAIEVSHADALGSVRALTDATGTLTQTYRTDPFGNPTATQGPSVQPFRYTGEQTDSTGLVYLRARMYDPQTGRFLQRDTLAKSGPGVSGWNRYAYASNNPVNFSDPSGRCVWDICIAETSAAIYALATVGVAFEIWWLNGGREQTMVAMQLLGEQVDAWWQAREGQSFTPAGKRKVKEENAKRYGGANVCGYCDAPTADPKPSKSGVTPPANEGQVDHWVPQSKGGAGSPENGAWSCRQCNRDKSDFDPTDPSDRLANYPR